MNPTPPTAEELFDRALEFSPAERPAFLAGACGDQPDLRRRVEALLAAHEQQTGFLPLQDTELSNPVLHPSTLTEGAGTPIGRYKLLEKLGEGGFGSVWAAEQKEPVRRRVALKIIKLGMDTQQVVARFEAERQALALMDHPNIARVLDAGATDAGRPYFVMELVKGIPITKYCDQEKLSTRERLDLFIKVCHAIQHAHQKGIIHRDIKPSNIMVTLHDGVPVPKVIDFGIAKATQAELTEKTIYTQYSQFIGTPAYMSPEQAEMSGLDIDTRSDIYSLGVLLYELLTGNTPFDTKELMQSGLDEMRRIIREIEPMRPSTRLTQQLRLANQSQSKIQNPKSKIETDLDWIVMKCLEKDRTRRYDTANGLAMDLQRHLNNEPVVACPPSAGYKLRKAWKRNKLTYTATAAVAAALIIGLGLSLWQYAGKSRAEREQIRLRQQAEARAQEATRARAQASEQADLANRRLYESLVREAHSIRKARQVGYRREVFDRIKQAVALGVEHKDLALLRREAAAAFGDWVGLDPVDIKIAKRAGRGCLSRDGTLAAIEHQDESSVSLHETRTGREVASLATGGAFILSVAFDAKGTALFISWSEQEFVSGKRPKNFHLEKWSLRGTGLWQRDWSRPSNEIVFVAPSDQGPVSLAFVDNDTALMVTDLEQSRKLAHLPISHPLPWSAGAAISPDRTKVAYFSLETTNSLDGQLEVRALPGGQTLTLQNPRQGRGVSLSFRNDGTLFTATFAGKAIAYDTAQWNSILAMQGTFEEDWGATSESASGLLAVPAGQQLGVRLIQAQSGREIALLNVPGIPRDASFSSDGKVLLVTHSHGARIIHLLAESEKRLLLGHQGGVTDVEFLPDGRQAVSTGKDRTLRLWDLVGGDSRILGELPAPGQTLSLTPDGKWLACGYYDISELSLWSLPSGTPLGRLDLTNSRFGTTWHCTFSPDGRQLVSIGPGLRAWDSAGLGQNPAPSNSLPTLRFSQTNGFASAAFDPAGKVIAYIGTMPELGGLPGLYVRGLAPEAEPRLIATNIEFNPVQSLCFLPKSGRLAYVTREAREIAILQPETWKLQSQVSTFTPQDSKEWYVANLTVSPDESRFALVTPSGLGVDLRDTQTGALIYTLPEEAGTIWWLAWSPDSQHVAVSRSNGEIAVWDLRDVETQLAQLGLQP